MLKPNPSPAKIIPVFFFSLVQSHKPRYISGTVQKPIVGLESQVAYWVASKDTAQNKAAKSPAQNFLVKRQLTNIEELKNTNVELCNERHRVYVLHIDSKISEQLQVIKSAQIRIEMLEQEKIIIFLRIKF